MLFDPGGRYGTFKNDPHERVRCVVLDRCPTLDQYWDWRTNWCGERWTEVFEWDLSPGRANALWDVLHAGSLDRRPFDPDYVGMACCLGVSDFLRAYGSPEVRLGERYFVPSNLAAFLWTQRPDRAWEFRYPEGTACVRPPAVGTAAAR